MRRRSSSEVVLEIIPTNSLRSSGRTKLTSCLHILIKETLADCIFKDKPFFLSLSAGFTCIVWPI